MRGLYWPPGQEYGSGTAMTTTKSASLKWITVSIALALFILTCTVVRAQTTAPPDPLFNSDEPLNITLTAPFRQIDRKRDKQAKYEGTLSYAEGMGAPVVLDVK